MNDRLEKIVSLCKRRGFIYPGSEIYGGLSGFWDYGPLGVALKNKIKNLWWQMFIAGRDDLYGLDTAIIMQPKTWEASGHVAGFSDPLSPSQQFNLMFKTSVGAGAETTTSYLRPETAGGLFVNFKNIVDSFHPHLPFGLGQIGKAFRNEIAPRDFIFRSREFEQMEIEYFVRSAEWEQEFEKWRQETKQFLSRVGLPAGSVHELEVPDGERAHYSQRTIDFEFDFPFGRRELSGLAYRGDFDLSAHQSASGADLTYLDEETKERFLPHVIEPSFGLDRLVLAVLTAAYQEDELGGETRVFLKLKPEIAPMTAAVFPLLKNKPDLVAKAREVYKMLKLQPCPTGRRATSYNPARLTGGLQAITFDDNGNIGKRYRRQDEIGTPYCITIDFDTLGETPALKDTVTVRTRDTGAQERVKISELLTRLSF